MSGSIEKRHRVGRSAVEVARLQEAKQTLAALHRMTHREKDFESDR
jgi:hypothetical protein